MRLFSTLQNSSYFCVFKYARAVKQKVWNETEKREWDTSHARRALRARMTEATLYRFLYWFWEKTRLFCSLVIQRCVEHVNCQLQSLVFFVFAVLSPGTSCFSKLAPWSLGFLGKSPDNNNNKKKQWLEFYLISWGIITDWIFNGDGDATKHDNHQHEIVKMSQIDNPVTQSTKAVKNKVTNIWVVLNQEKDSWQT